MKTGGHINRKLKAAKAFVAEVVKNLDSVHAAFLFGSSAKGTATPWSDVDVLVVLGKRDEKAYDVLAEAASRVYRETGEVIEFITMDVEEFYRLKSTSPFIYEVERWGKLLHLDGAPLAEGARELARLAREYMDSARRCASEGMSRLALDAGYNAVELLLKALILLTGKPLPRTHGGYIHVFAEPYVKTGRARANITRDLMRALEARNKARYEPGYTPTTSDWELVEKLYTELKTLFNKEAQTPTTTQLNPGFKA